MNGGRLAGVVRRLKPSAECFAAAAAVYGPDLMLQLACTPGAVEAPRQKQRRVAADACRAHDLQPG